MTNINRRDVFRVVGGTALGLAVGGAATRRAAAATISPDHGPIHLSGNENSYGPSTAVREALQSMIGDANRYGFAAQNEFVNEVARKEGVPPESIVLGAGSGELLHATALAFCGNDRDVIVPNPSFSMVARYTALVGGRVDYVSVDDELRLDLDAMSARITPNTGLVYIVNPNNPTGTLVDSQRLRDFCKSVPSHVAVLVDEAYLEYTDDFDKLTLLDLVKEGHNVIIARTFSKIHALAGMRVGYTIAKPGLSAMISKVKQAKFLGSLSIAAASASLKDTEYHAFCRARVKEGRIAIQDLCDDMGLRRSDAAGNFVFFEAGMSNEEFKRRMLLHGFQAARPFPPLLQWERVTIGTTEEMKKFAAVFPKIIAG